MIKSINGEIKIEGSPSVILSELTVVIRSVNTLLCNKLTKEEAREMLDKAHELAFVTPEELHKQAQDAMISFLKEALEDRKFADEFKEFLIQKIEKGEL